MNGMSFTKNDSPSLGVEVELQLVDANTFELKNCIDDVISHLSEDHQARIKPELMQSYLEINTDVCQNVSEVEKDLKEKLKVAGEAAAKAGAKLFWAGTHPFSPWSEQKITPTERYQRLVENLQDTARRLVTFGVHVHVGVDSGDKAVMICDRILRHLPTLLALSVNSPFWNGRDTGLHSQRCKIMESLPTAGLPPLMRNWSEYVWLVKQMMETHFIETIREIWWDVRPHHNFGTVEVRICDTPADLHTVLGLAALIQSLVHALSQEIDQGAYQFDCHPMMVRQNKWRACRHGLEAILVDPTTHKVQPARDLARELVVLLREYAQDLNCEDYLQIISEVAGKPTGSERQRAIYQETGDFKEIFRRMLNSEISADS